MNEKGERLMFGLFHKKEQKALELGAPVSGQAVPLQEVSDPTFGGEILGKGVAVRPTDGRIYAPADGEILFVIYIKVFYICNDYNLNPYEKPRDRHLAILR